MSSFVSNFPLFCIIMSLVCAAVSSLLKGRAASLLSRLLTLTVFVLSLCVLARGIMTGETVTYTMGHYTAPWGNEIRFGIVEPLLCACFSAVLLLCIVGGKRHIELDLEFEKLNLYFIMIDLIQAALLVLCYTNDIFTGYVFIEICTISSCAILMIRQVGRTVLAAVRYMIFSLLGSGLFLLGVIILYSITGHLLMPNIRESVAVLWESGQYHVPLTVTIALMTTGLAVKSGLFPFHFWMPDTYGYATPCSSGILSGVISKGYIFLLIKIIFSVIGVDVYYASGAQNILFVLGLLGIIFGSVSAIRENDVFRMTAYSSAAQIGYIYMGIGLSPALGILAALYQMMAHALTKPLLFLSASALSDVSGGSKRFSDLQGSAHRNRLAGIAFTVGALSMVGLPLFMGFISKYMFAKAALSAGLKLFPTLIVLAVSTVLNTIYFLRTVFRIYFPSETETFGALPIRRNKPFATAALVFIVANLTFGAFSQPLIDILQTGMALL